MFNKIRSIFRSRTPPKQVVKARFDAAQTTTDNHRHWAAADHLSADMEASPEVRRTLRQRARYEVANNSYAKGLVQMLANDTIGTGPRLQMLSSSEDFPAPFSPRSATATQRSESKSRVIPLSARTPPGRSRVRFSS